MFWIRFIKDLYIDYNSNSLDKKSKRECYYRYLWFYIRFIFNLILAPLGYTLWYILRKPISYKLYNYFKSNLRNHKYYISKNIYEIDDDYEFHKWISYLMLNNTDNNHRLDSDIKKALGWFYYKLYLFGDAEDPLGRGGLPEDYHSGRNTFSNRFRYSAIRNPWGNGIHLKMRSGSIKRVLTTLDTRISQNTSNYGTGDARVGTLIRWYLDTNNELWYYYERVYKSKIGWRDFYFGGVGCMNLKEGTPSNMKCCRWEQSNRPCKLV